MTTAFPLSEAEIKPIVTQFYAAVRQDPALGPLFNGAIHDWPSHLQTLADFWSSVMLTSGRYKGNPVAAHRKHLGAITPALFDRWLALWAETTNASTTPDAAAMLQSKAARIAESLKLALFYQPMSRSLSEAAAPRL